MTDTNITLGRFEVCTGATADWLCIRATTQGPWAMKGREWALLSLERHLNFCEPRTHVDPDSPGGNTMLGVRQQARTLHLDCGCCRQTTSIITVEEAKNRPLAKGRPHG